MNDKQSPAKRQLHTLIDLIEQTRLSRIEAHRAHHQVKGFSQQELNDIIYPTYKNLLVGRSQRLPTREKLMEIADYLECTMAERNDLLICGGYLPIAQEPEGKQLTALLQHAHSITAALRLPAMVITRDWCIHYSNALYDALFCLPPLIELTEAQHNGLTRMFDPDLPFRTRYGFSAENWRQVASRNLYYFQEYNRLYLHEGWYRKLVEAGARLPDFVDFWNEEAFEVDKLYTVRCALGVERTVGQIAGVHISFSEYFYPAIWAFVAVDEAALNVFDVIGCQSEQAHWLTKMQR